MPNPEEEVSKPGVFLMSVTQLGVVTSWVGALTVIAAAHEPDRLGGADRAAGRLYPANGESRTLMTDGDKRELWMHERLVPVRP